MILFQSVKTVPDLIAASGAEHGNRVFLRYEEENAITDVTYAEFAACCKDVSARFVKERADAVHNVGVLGGGSKEYLAVFFGIMSSGNVAIPLDIQADVNSLCDLVEKGDIDILFYDDAYAEKVRAVAEKCKILKETVSLKKAVERASGYGKMNYSVNVSPEQCAMILFTSGTTGKQKGVMLSHKNLIDNVFCTTDEGHPENEIYMNVLPVHHIFCLNGDFLLAVRYGNVLCLNRELAKLDSHIQLFNPTVIRMVPMMAKSLFNRFCVLKELYPDKSNTELREQVYGKSLKKIVSGGGYLSPELAKNYQNIGILISQGYGMSECSPKISSPDWSRPDKTDSVGKIVDRCEVRIVDGEIQVKSPSVMMGYYKDKEETEKIITEDGWLKTGDLGYKDSEGYLYFTGRSKNLIILSNGENVAPEQLENMFDGEALVEDILVFGDNDRLCAEVYPNFALAKEQGTEDIQSAISDIVAKVNKQLPGYKKIMSVSVRHVPFEKTSTRKILRDRFEQERVKKSTDAEGHKKPVSEKQKELFAIVSESLGHTDFGIDTSVFDAGIDSLGSVLLLSSLFERLNFSITLEELREINTVEKLEKYMESKRVSEVDYSPRNAYPLTVAQMYFAYVLCGNTITNIPFLIKLHKDTDLMKLKKATEQVFELHPEMKCVIRPDETGMLFNFRNDARVIDFPMVSLTEEEWAEIKSGLVVPFNYDGSDNLYHGAIYKTPSAAYFFFDLAHISADGVSMNIVLEDISLLYQGKTVTKTPYTFYEYIIDESIMRQGQLFIDNAIYCSQLDYGAKVTRSILNKKDCYALEKGKNQTYKRYLDKITKDEIKDFCKNISVSENVLFLSAYSLCAELFSNRDDSLTTSIHNGRIDSRWNKLVGSVFEPYHFRHVRTEKQSVKELLCSSATQILTTMNYQVPALHVDEVLFQYQGEILNVDSFCGLPSERVPLEVDSLPFHMQIFSHSDKYTCDIHYWENRFDEDAVRIFVDCYEAIIKAMLKTEFVDELPCFIPENFIPDKTEYSAEDINSALNLSLFPENTEETVSVFVLDKFLRKKPYMAWGDLYVSSEPCFYAEKVKDPFGEGVLYKVGLTVRTETDNSLQELNSCGRKIMVDSETGREFIDLRKIEEAILGYKGVTNANAYTGYFPQKNGFVAYADVWGISENEKEELKNYLSSLLPPSHIPNDIIIIS